MQRADLECDLVVGERRRDVPVLPRLDRRGGGSGPLDAPPQRAVPELDLLDPAGGRRGLAVLGRVVGLVLVVDDQVDRARPVARRREHRLRIVVRPAPPVARRQDAGRKELDPLRRPPVVEGERPGQRAADQGRVVSAAREPHRQVSVSTSVAAALPRWSRAQSFAPASAV